MNREIYKKIIIYEQENLCKFNKINQELYILINNNKFVDFN